MSLQLKPISSRMAMMVSMSIPCSSMEPSHASRSKSPVWIMSSRLSNTVLTVKVAEPVPSMTASCG